MKFDMRYYRVAHSLIARLLEEAITQEELAPLDTTYTADALLATFGSDLYLFQRHRRGYTPEQILEGIRRIYIQACLFALPATRLATISLSFRRLEGSCATLCAAMRMTW